MRLAPDLKVGDGIIEREPLTADQGREAAPAQKARVLHSRSQVGATLDTTLEIKESGADGGAGGSFDGVLLRQLVHRAREKILDAGMASSPSAAPNWTPQWIHCCRTRRRSRR